MMMKRLIILVLAATALCSAWAQKTSVKGKTMSIGGQPVAGAIVSVKSGTSTALSDADGIFALSLTDDNAIVVVKADGYLTLELPSERLTRGGNLCVVTLTPDYQNGGDILKKNTAGMQILKKSGMPGEGNYMNIRGIHSLVADNSPLLVVNGVPYFGNQDVSGVISGYSRDLLFAFDTNDIRSVKVLKGAEAAQYGSMGSNGVVAIETHQANSDNLETRMTFSGSYGLNLKPKAMPLMGSADYRNYINDIGMTQYQTMEQLVADYPFLTNGTYPQANIFNENTNWMDVIQQTGFVTDNTFRVEGGDQIAKYNISFGYTGNRGTLRNTSSDRYHTLISADVMASRKMDIFANIHLAYITSDLNSQGMTPETNPMIAAQRAMPLISAYKKQTDGTVLADIATYDFWNTSASPVYAYDNVSNPLALVTTVEATDKIYDVHTQVGANYRWNKYLTLTALANLYYNYTEETLFVPGVSSRAILPQVYGTGKNKVANSVLTQTLNTYQLSAAYNRTIQRVNELSANLTARMITRKTELDIAEGWNTPSDEFKTLNNTQNEKRSWGANTEWNYMGLALSGDYTHKRIWQAKAGLAIDGTSASGSNAPRWGWFPSLGGKVMMANTGWLPEFISTMNLSVEGSMSGNSRFSSNYGTNHYEGSSYFDIGSITRANVPNTKLQWEKKTQLDVGMQLGLWRERLSVSATLFASHAYDLLLNSSISAQYGARDYYDNCAAINTHGLELGITALPLSTRNWQLRLSADIATAKGKIATLGGEHEMVISYTGYDGDDATTLMRVGEKPYEFFGYQTAGVYSSTKEAESDNLTNAAGKKYQAGDVRFVDQNGDGVINLQDRVPLGSAMPDWYGSACIDVCYKRLSLSADFSFAQGGKLYNATRRMAEGMENFYNQSTAALNRWQVEGQQTSMPRAAYGDPMGNNSFSDRWIEDGSYLKLRSLRLTLAFDKLLGFVRSGRVYVEGDNLFCLSDYLGSDPEFAYSYSEALRGFDYAKVPLSRTVMVGFDINF